MAEKKETKKAVDKKTSNVLEREYVIPLRARYQHVARYKKTPKAIKTVKEFLVKHMKIYDRDLNKIKIDKYLNEFLWARGIKNPPHKVKVKAIKNGETVKVELVEFSTKLKFKKARAEKAEKAVAEKVKGKKAVADAVKKETLESKTKEAEAKVEEKEKKASVVEAGKALEKAASKRAKHDTGGKTKAPKRPQRKALAK
ncbi:50S ribosomal protein L31e [archaeon]|jgi:large subunit ribosomal protein L31e|nr:50S ribosomal protein L31e [archaeon]MBT4373296.1 50S ribosomal protein L31e [archaeon]MBT4531641.1 50S ribosomal protein L31e [archaeon]MBT7001181.1 50S ribosomal protein L31e [archaeon]MBT7282333.1 50S ribosomal protein L31e [archaeon]